MFKFVETKSLIILTMLFMTQNPIEKQNKIKQKKYCIIFHIKGRLEGCCFLKFYEGIIGKCRSAGRFITMNFKFIN